MTASLEEYEDIVSDAVEDLWIAAWMYEVMAFEAFLDLLEDPEFDALTLFMWEEYFGVDFSDLEEWMLP